MQSITKHIPNTITLTNLICGVISIFLASSPDTREIAAYLILLAMVFDFFDGFAARLLKVSGALGKELDSLSDLVSFGVAPAVLLMYHLKEISPNISIYLVVGLLCLVPAFSALRLGRFNLDSRQSVHFIGLPTPANALLLTSLYLMQLTVETNFLNCIFTNKPIAIIITTLVAAILLNSSLPLFSFKIKTDNKKLATLQIGLIIIAISLFVIWGFASIPLTIIIYIIASGLFRKLQNIKQ
jgi:CDP-diacylglycerol---serine O-phosphatidyltransferase